MAALHLNNVSDYIEPSMACINPLFTGGVDKTNEGEPTTKKKPVVALSLEMEEGEQEPEPAFEPKKATISLSDCLACSGCVTSSESVLVNNQSKDALVSALGSAKSVSFMMSAVSMVELERHYEDQVGASLGRETVEGVLEGRLRAWCAKQGGVCEGIYTSDSSWVRKKWLADSYNEFLTLTKRSEEERKSRGPVLTSHCPGFVCYAEKSAHIFVDMLSSVKSCMMLTSDRLRGEAKEFIVAVEPCHDKKLEATRGEFKDSDDGRFGVDLVITTKDIKECVEDGWSLMDWLVGGGEEGFGGEEKEEEEEEVGTAAGELSLASASFLSLSNSTSGGLAESIFRTFAASNYGLKEYLDFSLPLPWGREGRRRRGTDGIKECWIIRASSGETQVCGPESSPKGADFSVLHRFALAYGFKSIQVLQSHLSKGSKTYDYMEVMACPSGCANGGGGIRAEGAGGIEVKEGASDIKKRVESAVEVAKAYVMDWELGEAAVAEEEGFGEAGKTTFKKVEALKLSGGNVDGVEVGQTVW
ncbi:hypothetical protein TrRE_jg9430 [Triparma retinervis]|uniref:Iron hydrogenase large subunit C-terminal domain-containing protein n=1 Tax=Triparma retinervis TaxID=2557542 RepID=A0A9W7KVA7_9STRA|nr:hypothetical protein TrRE_jg9430 [Triparma retinervis]